MMPVLSTRVAWVLSSLGVVGVLAAGCSTSYSVDPNADVDAGANVDASSGAADGSSSGAPDGSSTMGTDSGPAAPITLDLGTGAEGAFNGASLYTTTCAGHVSGTAGSTTLTSAGPGGKFDKFPAGSAVLLLQTQGMGAGTYEIVTVQTSGAGKSATLTKPLLHTFSDPGAQAVLVHQFTDVTVPMGQALSAAAWDGLCGGVLAFRATGTVNVLGTIDMSGRGFRGNVHGCVAGGAAYECNAVTPDTGSTNGFAGESEVGAVTQSSLAHGSGGGGGMDGTDCGMGGGGGHGTAGVAGPNGGGKAPCRANTAQNGGAAGTSIGSANLSQSLFFGGAGGEGGADEDGAVPGGGGNGGGIIYIEAKQLLVTGALDVSGGGGGAGVATGACGGTGAGMGGGGGGAGGSVRLAAYSVDVGTTRVVAKGAAGGACGGVPATAAGAGAVGRIGVLSQATKGVTLPPFDPR